jgi:hypothetical protein
MINTGVPWARQDRLLFTPRGENFKLFLDHGPKRFMRTAANWPGIGLGAKQTEKLSRIRHARSVVNPQGPSRFVPRPGRIRKICRLKGQFIEEFDRKVLIHLMNEDEWGCFSEKSAAILKSCKIN